MVGNVIREVYSDLATGWTTKESRFVSWYGQGVLLMFTALKQARTLEPLFSTQLGLFLRG
jgi:uracil DNA glycosylase